MKTPPIDVRVAAHRFPHSVELHSDLRGLDTAGIHRALVDHMVLDMDLDLVYGLPGMQVVHRAPSLWAILRFRRPGLTWRLRLRYLRCLVRGHDFRLDRVEGRRPHTRVWCPDCGLEVYRRNDP